MSFLIRLRRAAHAFLREWHRTPEPPQPKKDSAPSFIAPRPFTQEEIAQLVQVQKYKIFRERIGAER